MMLTKQCATVEDLYNTPGKTELVHGELIKFVATGIKPAKAGGRIYSSLERYEDERGGGYAVPDNAGFLVDLPNRESFSPDVAWVEGEAPANPDTPLIFRRGEIADAEPAVPGWRFPVNNLFR